MSDWQNRRPIFDSLPEVGYKDNSVADSLTSWIDEKLSLKADQLQNFYKELDPDTCQSGMLEYLAFLHGLSGKFWDNGWKESTKRTLIKNSHKVLWKLRGTAKPITFVLNAHGIQHSIWTDGSTNLTFKLPAKLAVPKLRFYLRMPLIYARDSWQWKEARRTANNFAPAVTSYVVCHNAFYLGFSRLGEPLFR